MTDSHDLNDFLAIKKASDIQVDVNISLKNKYIYFMICKAASSTITHHLQTAEYIGTNFKVQDVNNAYLSPHLRWLHFQDGDFLKLLSDPSYKKFSFVRNPYTRLLSCYLHRIVGDRKLNPSKKALLSGMNINYKTGTLPSFSEFVEFVCDQKSVEMERHWAVQHDCILYPYIEFDFIGKLENLSQDLKRLESELFPYNAFDSEKMKSLNKSPMVTGASKQLSKHYTDSLMGKVLDRFRLDFDTFDYSYELPC